MTRGEGEGSAAAIGALAVAEVLFANGLLAALAVGRQTVEKQGELIEEFRFFKPTTFASHSRGIIGIRES